MARLTGRIGGAPAILLHEEVLEPQFSHDVRHLLPHYLHIEKVLLVEYRRMGILAEGETRAIARALDGIGPGELMADPHENMSDLSFGIERLVSRASPAPAWHVDRSRNDAQACAQLMFGRERVLRIAAELLACAAAAHALAAGHTDAPMPGYTHLQAAQVISPGFYVTALVEHFLHSARRLLATYDRMDRCPLGSGAMAGQELPWDRESMAGLLGFAGPVTHALTGVASRAWLLELAGECATFATGLNRFVTDLMTWAGGRHGLIELPDELAGISSAMPQKKNYPIFERIRGKTAHLLSWYVDVSAAQRGTPYSNTVEAAKEGGAQLVTATQALESALRLLALALRHTRFPAERGLAGCTGEFLGGFSLANRLTLEEGVPWRTAQVVAGTYITTADSSGGGIAEEKLLGEIAREHGHPLKDPAALLSGLSAPEDQLRRKRSAGSTAPEAVHRMLADQEGELAALEHEWAARRHAAESAPARVNALLGLEDPA
ncbi:lyase family protein [Nonomuraea sp. NPDC050786]|uniref:argininosuccinate lyase n=1 Tax=Nonomuraea sp. NPDC050786 TaxID=3154840 RepID=UPI0033E3D96D